MGLPRRGLLTVLGASTMALAGCTASEEPEGPTGTPTMPPSQATYAYTHLQASGNRSISGEGSVGDVTPVDITVDGEPAWLLAFGDTASYWTVVTTDGAATTHRVGDGTSERVQDHGTVSSPPLAYMAEAEVAFVDRPEDCAEFTHPVVLDDGLLYVAENGDVVIWRAESTTRLDVDAPVDGRPVAIDGNRYALYGNRTTRYKHGALGDTTEGGSLVVVDVANETIAVEVTLDSPAVFEGLSPLVADLDGDGEVELLTTVADSADGARIRAYGTDGEELATGPVYGSGWRHQLCVSAFGPEDGSELAVVRKPHVDRTVEFYEFSAGGLQVTATQGGYSSHTYGSRNLDGGLAADLDADGHVELLVPRTARQSLEAVRRVDGGAASAWSLSLDGELATNVTGVALADDRVAIGAGTADKVRIWQG